MSFQARAEPGAPLSVTQAGARRALWPFLALLIAATVLPTVLFGGLALHERQALLREGEQTAIRTAHALTEHARKVLETHSLVLDQVDEQTRDRSWADIESDVRLQRNLTALAAKFPQIRAVRLLDADGRRRKQSQVAGAPPLTDDRSDADRDYFLAHREGFAGRYFISRPFVGRNSGERQFAVSVRRTTADGSFDGIIAVSVDIAYFSRVWEQFAPSVHHVIPLMREDGYLLARYPLGDHPERLAPTGPYMQQIARAPAGGFYTARSQVDGVERMNAYNRVGDYPLYVSFSLETGALLAPWRTRAMLYALLSLITSLALGAVALMAMRQTLAQRRAAAAWQEAALRSEAEIRRRERAEAELLQAQKMEAVGQLTGGVAHDFNNLLHAMLLNVQVAEHKLGQSPASRHLDNIRRGIDRAAQLTKQLTAFSRRQRLEPCNFAPAALIVRMADLLDRTLGGTIQLDIVAGQDLWHVYADPGQTELALLNLAVNARDAMPRGGRLTIRARNVQVPAGIGNLPSGDYVELAVTDTGTGMTPEVAKRVFEPFFTTKEVGKGSGLGLSMVHGFVTQSGGSVAVESEPGRGTTVTLLLPRGTSEGAGLPDEPRVPDSQMSRVGGRIVLVDDDSLVRASTLLALKEAGYSVEEASHGGEALDILRDDPPDLLITDYAMPGMTGTELAARAREMQPGLPVILVTGYAQPTLGAEPMQHVDVVLHKPFAPTALVEQIERLVSPRGALNVDAAVDLAKR